MTSFQLLGYVPHTTRLVAGSDTLNTRIRETIAETPDADLRYTLELISNSVSEQEFRTYSCLIVERNGFPLHVFRNFMARSERFLLYPCRNKAADEKARGTARKRALALTGLFFLLVSMGSRT